MSFDVWQFFRQARPRALCIDNGIGIVLRPRPRMAHHPARAASLAMMGALLTGLLVSMASNSAAAEPKPAPVDRALAFLTDEVPLWRKENGCFSCHNNGDGARALYTAVGHSRDVPRQVLDETTRWLVNPDRWDENKGDPAFSDKKLARIQFAAALTAAMDAGVLPKQQLGTPESHRNRAGPPLVEAAERLVRDQQRDGSWSIDAAGSIGSPVTYGPVLATYLARRTLETADSNAFRTAIENADRWLAGQKPINVLDASAVLLALDGKSGPGVVAERARLLKLLAGGQSSDGGWGPYVNAPPEVFDTAVALLALVKYRVADGSKGNAAGTATGVDVDEMVFRGRRYLIDRQLRDGSWPETTRPTGAESYAQRLSTAAWATMALMVSEPLGE